MVPEPFTTLVAIAAPLTVSDMDTGQIFPSRFLRKQPSHGLGRYLFHDLRFDTNGNERSDFVLNQPPYRDARILVAGTNFGCGSAREAAVLALIDAGFRCVIAPEFADIFRTNSLRSGLLPITLTVAQVQQLAECLTERPGSRLAVDLEAQTVRRPDGSFLDFDIEPERKRRFLLGLNDWSLALDAMDRIAAFEKGYTQTVPWSRTPNNPRPGKAEGRDRMPPPDQTDNSAQ